MKRRERAAAEQRAERWRGIARTSVHCGWRGGCSCAREPGAGRLHRALLRGRIGNGGAEPLWVRARKRDGFGCHFPENAG